MAVMISRANEELTMWQALMFCDEIFNELPMILRFVTVS